MGMSSKGLVPPVAAKAAPPRKRNLKNEVGPWMQGCAPQNTTPNIRPTPFWWDRDEGQTDNENEEEDKIGTAGASEEEDNE